ncbi:MAG: Gx transporter family protein [Clostridia bacterium]|nr:Gx transporter family protein [Clostridia bacterium]
MKKTNVRKLTCLALIVSFAMILSYIEAKIPVFVAIPGVKMGLANIAVIFVLYKMGAKEAAVVSALRIFLISILFGNVESLFFSLMGGLLSFAVMLLLKKLTPLGEVAVSVSGGVMHNVGQIIAAMMLLQTDAVMYYLPFLILSGTIAGVVVGVVSALLIKRVRL